MEIHTIVKRQHDYFHTGKTLPVERRIAALNRLKASILRHEADIQRALQADLGKSPAESYLCEIGITLSELGYLLRHTPRFARPHWVLPSLSQLPARCYTIRNPYGVVLLLSPWNYPFLLTMEPLLGAIAAGNCCVVKPSEDSPATSALLREIIEECFPPEFVTVVEGDREESQALLRETFDYIFYTGGGAVGRIVMGCAAEHLTPVTLELGGKSPCVVDKTADLNLAAKRIVFGKLLNGGQTCVAPDYVLVERKAEDAFLSHLQYHLRRMAGKDPLTNENFVHMINKRHFDRVVGLIDPAKVAVGGRCDAASLRIEPTVLRGVSESDPVMQEEIFGPVLPILTFDTMEEAIASIRRRPHPLACYLFSRDKEVQKRFLEEVSFGGGCINDTILHLASSHMGFGGVGESGMGSYHGKKSFETFSHEKSIVKKGSWPDPAFRYPPYTTGKEWLIRRFLK